MKKIMKTVQSSYLHLSNILSNQVEFLSRVIESSFSTRSECLSSTSQLNSTLFKSSTWLELKYSTWRDQFSLSWIFSCQSSQMSSVSFVNKDEFESFWNCLLNVKKVEVNEVISLITCSWCCASVNLFWSVWFN